MAQYRKTPLKLYIQDIFRAKQSDFNKYVYEMFGVHFKNVMLHGVVTCVYNTTERSTNFELSDPTGCVQVYLDYTKSNKSISKENMKELIQGFAKISKDCDTDVKTMSFMLDKIEGKQKLKVKESDFVNVIGDIFVDDFKNARMISAFEVNVTSIERDILWMEELRYVYDEHYLK